MSYKLWKYAFERPQALKRGAMSDPNKWFVYAPSKKDAEERLMKTFKKLWPQMPADYTPKFIERESL